MKNPEENKKPPIEKSSTTTTQENTGESTQDSDDAVPSTSAQAAGYCPGAIPTPEIDLENLATEYIVLLAEEMAVELGTAARLLEKAFSEIISNPDCMRQYEELGLSEEEKAAKTPSTSSEEDPVDLDEAFDFCRTLLTCEMEGDSKAAWKWLDDLSEEVLTDLEADGKKETALKQEKQEKTSKVQVESDGTPGAPKLRRRKKKQSERRVKAESTPRRAAVAARNLLTAITLRERAITGKDTTKKKQHKRSETSHTETAVVLEPGEGPEVALVITLDYEGRPVLSPTTTPGSPLGLPVLSTSPQHSSTSPASTSSIACSPPSRSPYTSSGEGTKALCRPPKLEPEQKTQPEEGAARTRQLHRPPRPTKSPSAGSTEDTARTQEEAVPKQKEGGKRSQKRRRHESDKPSGSLTAGVKHLSASTDDPGEGPSSSLSAARQRQTSKRARQ